jgi:hypothetical protein
VLSRRFEPRLAIFGWFLLAWTLLAHASTAQFAWSIGGKASKWLDAHAWAGSLCGFGLLALAVIWRDLEPRLPEWLRPRTTSERLAALEDTIETTIQPMEMAFKVVSGRQEADRERIEQLTLDLEAHTKELQTALQGTERGIVS